MLFEYGQSVSQHNLKKINWNEAEIYGFGVGKRFVSIDVGFEISKQSASGNNKFVSVPLVNTYLYLSLQIFVVLQCMFFIIF